MWLGKFLDLSEDIKSMSADIKKKLFGGGKKKRLTPLEFVILESILNSNGLSGYDIMQKLNKNFAGTWKAYSGTIYPILSKLKYAGFLTQKAVKSPIGPLKNIYKLTSEAQELLKYKVNKSFLDQIKFVENFLIELTSIYLKSLSEDKLEENALKVRDLVKDVMENVLKSFHSSVRIKRKCPGCNSEIDRDYAEFCSYCGVSLNPKSKDEREGEFDSTHNTNSGK